MTLVSIFEHAVTCFIRVDTPCFGVMYKSEMLPLTTNRSITDNLQMTNFGRSLYS